MNVGFVSDRAAASKFVLTGALSGLTAWSTTFEQVQKLLEQLKKFGIPPQAAGWGLTIALAAAAAYFLVQSLAQQSRLVQPDRFRLNPENGAHLKGRVDDIERLARLCEQRPLVFMDGESGSGKSALLRGGLIPHLAEPRLIVLACDLSGAPWDEGLTRVVAQALIRALNDDQRKKLAWQTMPTGDTALAEVARLEPVLGRKPLLAFDQFDDYQDAYRDRFFHEGSGELRTMAAFVESNRFWRGIEQGLRAGHWHVLLITRSDQRAGLDLVRFADIGSFTLRRVPRNQIAAVFDDITTVGKDERPVVVNADRGWNLLRERLLDDLRDPDSGDVLPIQLAIALQGLQDLSPLTIGEYTRVGGAEGLARLQVKREVTRTAQEFRLEAGRVLAALYALTDAERRKSRRLPEQALTRILLGIESAANGAVAELDRARSALLQLKDRHVLRSGVDAREMGDAAGDWLLYHDYLARGIVAATRERHRWQHELLDHAKRYRCAVRLRQRWQELLPLGLQLRLLWERWKPRARITSNHPTFVYGEQLRYAVLSALKPLAAAIVLGTASAISLQAYHYQQDLAAAGALLDTLTGHSDLNPKELEALRVVESHGRRAAAMALARAFRRPTSVGSGGHDNSAAIDQNVREVRPALARLVHRALALHDDVEHATWLLGQLEVASSPTDSTNAQLILLADLLGLMEPTTVGALRIRVAGEIAERMADKEVSDIEVVARLSEALAGLVTKVSDTALLNKGAQALVDRMADKAIYRAEGDRLVEALAGLATKVSDTALLNKWAQALVDQMADKASDSKVVARLGYALADLAVKVSDTALLNKGAQALVDRMADKVSDSEVVASLSEALAGLAAKVNDTVLVNRWAQALVDQLADKKVSDEAVARLGEEFAGLVAKVSDTALLNKGAQALVDRMADKAVSDSEIVARLGQALVRLAAKVSDTALLNKGAQALLDQLAGKVHRDDYASQLREALAGLAAKVNDTVLVNRWAQALVDRIADKSIKSYDVKKLGEALAGLATKVSDTALLNKGGQALVDQMADKAIYSDDVADLGEALAGLAARAGPDQKSGLARLALSAQRLRISWKFDSKQSETLVQAIDSVPVDELLDAMSSAMGAEGDGRNVLLAALRSQAGVKDSDDYWAVIGALRRTHPRDFAQVLE